MGVPEKFFWKKLYGERRELSRNEILMEVKMSQRKNLDEKSCLGFFKSLLLKANLDFKDVKWGNNF